MTENDWWCNARHPHEIGVGICSCRGAKEARAARREQRALDTKRKSDDNEV